MKDVREWVDIGFKVILALIGAAFGYVFSYQKQQNDDIRLVMEMATSPEEPKRRFSAEVARVYYDQDRIPASIYAAIYSHVNNSNDTVLQAIVNTSVAATSRGDENLRQAVTKATRSLPIRVYFHIRQPSDRATATVIKEKVESTVIEDGSVTVPGIQYIDGSQSKSILKCFRKDECSTIGPNLVRLFHQSGVELELVDLSQAYENSNAIRPKHFEAWFASLPLR